MGNCLIPSEFNERSRETYKDRHRYPKCCDPVRIENPPGISRTRMLCTKSCKLKPFSVVCNH